MIRTTSGIPATIDTMANLYAGKWPFVALVHRSDDTPAPRLMVFHGQTPDEAQTNALRWLGATTYEETAP